MFCLTSTPFAPWIVLESDDKPFLPASRRSRSSTMRLEARLHGE